MTRTLWICGEDDCLSLVQTDGSVPGDYCASRHAKSPLILHSDPPDDDWCHHDPRRWPYVLATVNGSMGQYRLPAGETLRQIIYAAGIIDGDLVKTVTQTAMSLTARPGIFAFPTLENERVFASVFDAAVNEQDHRSLGKS